MDLLCSPRPCSDDESDAFGQRPVNMTDMMKNYRVDYDDGQVYNIAAKFGLVFFKVTPTDIISLFTSFILGVSRFKLVIS